VADSSQMREFIEGILRDMKGNAILSIATGRTTPKPDNPLGKLVIEEHHWFRYPEELDLMVEFAETPETGDRRNKYLSPQIYGDEPGRRKVKGKDGAPDTYEVVTKTRDGRPVFSRSKANALWAQTIYMDSDSCPPGAFRLTPSRHVETSEGHGHDYWFLTEPIPAGEAADIAHRITTAHQAEGTDPSGWSPNKLLRLPTVNTSYDKDNPFVIRWADGGDIYADTDVLGAYEDVEIPDAPAATGEVYSLGPVPDLEGLPDFETLVERIPSTEHRLNDLIYKQPKTGPGGWRSEQRFALLLDLMRFGFTPQETVAIAWHSPAAAKFREDGRQADGLWWEIQNKVMPILNAERGVAVSAAPKRKKRAGGPTLLSPTERKRFQSTSDLITLYLEEARFRVPVFNGPLHQGNAVALLSLGLGEVGGIPKGGKMMPLNIYQIQASDSGSGKSEAKDILMPIVHNLYPNDNPDIGFEQSKGALIEMLIARDGKVSFLNGDEAHGKLAELKGGGWTTGIQETWTFLYDGKVPSLGRVGKEELAKAGRTTILSMHLSGTMSGLLKVIDREMYYSGFLARPIWIIGESYPVTQESLKTKVVADVEVFYEAMPRWWASYFLQLRTKISNKLPLGQRRAKMEMTDEALERFDAAKWTIWQHFEGQYDIELWTTVLRRMFDTINKVAALEALSFGRTFIATRDIEVALGYAEVWLDNAAVIADQISDTFFSRQCDEIEKFIASKPGQQTDIGAIYRFRKSEPKRYTDEYLQSLASQGRVVEYSHASMVHYRIKETA
jgi:hypothetical protein